MGRTDRHVRSYRGDTCDSLNARGTIGKEVKYARRKKRRLIFSFDLLRPPYSRRLRLQPSCAAAGVLLRGRRYGFAAPGVGVVVKCQSVAALSVSAPFGLRIREPWTVFESATLGLSAVPSTRLKVPGAPLIVAATIEPS